jgi:hypothetical protein
VARKWIQQDKEHGRENELNECKCVPDAMVFPAAGNSKSGEAMLSLQKLQHQAFEGRLQPTPPNGLDSWKCWKMSTPQLSYLGTAVSPLNPLFMTMQQAQEAHLPAQPLRISGLAG